MSGSVRGPELEFPEWLALREPADAAARAGDLADQVRATLAPGRPVVVHDLGCGTGSMPRWLAPRLPGPQHWVLHDRDADLLRLASSHAPTRAADDSPVTVETRQSDVTRLATADLAGASLLTASALLDMLTADELDRLVGTCVAAGTPTLVVLSVVGRVVLEPHHPLDAALAEAFNAHQRRDPGTGRLLGPDAVEAAVTAFTTRGWDVVTRPSPWRMGPAEAALAAEWLLGWVAAACEQRPELVRDAAPYTERRLAEADAGMLRITVHHEDLLALPR